MKRIIRLFMLSIPVAMVGWGCDAADQAGSVSGPDLKPAKPCEPWPECNQPGGEEGRYTKIDLPSPKRGFGIAYDISEPLGQVVTIVGSGATERSSPEFAVVWSGIPDQLSDERLPLDAEYVGGRAIGINDNASLIVGRLSSKATPIPVAWTANGGGWSLGEELDLGIYQYGEAQEANEGGMIVGWVIDSTGAVAGSSWASTAAPPVVLPSPSPYTVSQAYGINNGGWIVGEMSDPAVAQSTRAVLWAPGGTHCDLHPAGEIESVAFGLEEEQGRTVLVAGKTLPSMKPAIWAVNVATCQFTFETIEIGTGQANDVRRVTGGWEAVGTDDDMFRGQPAWWASDGGSEMLYNGQGYPLAITGGGHIVGWFDHAARPHAALWVPGQP